MSQNILQWPREFEDDDKDLDGDGVEIGGADEGEGGGEREGSRLLKWGGREANTDRAQTTAKPKLDDDHSDAGWSWWKGDNYTPSSLKLRLKGQKY